MTIEYYYDKSLKRHLCYVCKNRETCPLDRLYRVLVEDKECWAYIGDKWQSL